MTVRYQCTRKDGAVGVDGQTAQQYVANLEGNPRSLIDRLKSGTYRALPVKRHYILKSGPIYEQNFLDCSFGFRPGRSAHQALQTVRTGIMERGGRWVLDIDVRKYFSSISHAKLREFLARRVTDGVVRRLLGKWLKAGVLEGRGEEGNLLAYSEGARGATLSLTRTFPAAHNSLDGVWKRGCCGVIAAVCGPGLAPLLAWRP